MSFFKELSSISEFLHSIRKLEDYFSFDMKFPSSWGLPKSFTQEENIVPFSYGSDELKGISFVAKNTESDIDTTLAKILKVIKINKDREVKEKLFKETIEKLKRTFETTDLDDLNNLYFDFKKNEELDGNKSRGAILELVDEGTEERQKRPRVRKTEVDSRNIEEKQK